MSKAKPLAKIVNLLEYENIPSIGEMLYRSTLSITTGKKSKPIAVTGLASISL